MLLLDFFQVTIILKASTLYTYNQERSVDYLEERLKREKRIL